MVRDIRDRMDCAPVAYTTAAKVTSILSEKDLLIRIAVSWAMVSVRSGGSHDYERLADAL